MHPEASQKRTRMVSRCVPKSSIRILASPGEDGSAVNDKITGSNESGSQSVQNRENEERLMQRGTSYVATFALLRFARNADASLFI
jgi:hypothetical protein